MTKQYNGSGVYKIYFDSGKEMELTESELEELHGDVVPGAEYDEAICALDSIKEFNDDLDIKLFVCKDQLLEDEDNSTVYSRKMNEWLESFIKQSEAITEVIEIFKLKK